MAVGQHFAVCASLPIEWRHVLIYRSDPVEETAERAAIECMASLVRGETRSESRGRENGRAGEKGEVTDIKRRGSDGREYNDSLRKLEKLQKGGSMSTVGPTYPARIIIVRRKSGSSPTKRPTQTLQRSSRINIASKQLRKSKRRRPRLRAWISLPDHCQRPSADGGSSHDAARTNPRGGSVEAVPLALLLS
jgi:hypothetical protein